MAFVATALAVNPHGKAASIAVITTAANIVVSGIFSIVIVPAKFIIRTVGYILKIKTIMGPPMTSDTICLLLELFIANKTNLEKGTGQSINNNAIAKTHIAKLVKKGLDKLHDIDSVSSMSVWCACYCTEAGLVDADTVDVYGIFINHSPVNYGDVMIGHIGRLAENRKATRPTSANDRNIYDGLSKRIIKTRGDTFFRTYAVLLFALPKQVCDGEPVNGWTSMNRLFYEPVRPYGDDAQGSLPVLKVRGKDLLHAVQQNNETLRTRDEIIRHNNLNAYIGATNEEEKSLIVLPGSIEIPRTHTIDTDYRNQIFKRLKNVRTKVASYACGIGSALTAASAAGEIATESPCYVRSVGYACGAAALAAGSAIAYRMGVASTSTTVLMPTDENMCNILEVLRCTVVEYVNTEDTWTKTSKYTTLSNAKEESVHKSVWLTSAVKENLIPQRDVCVNICVWSDSYNNVKVTHVNSLADLSWMNIQDAAEQYNNSNTKILVHALPIVAPPIEARRKQWIGLKFTEDTLPIVYKYKNVYTAVDDDVANGIQIPPNSYVV